MPQRPGRIKAGRETEDGSIYRGIAPYANTGRQQNRDQDRSGLFSSFLTSPHTPKKTWDVAPGLGSAHLRWGLISGFGCGF